ncbi:MAG: hypothetical protein AB7L17_14375 [Ilumatobacteraceae bacterium]
MADEPVSTSSTGAAAEALVAELEAALATAREQQALIRTSLGRVIAQLDPDSPG